MRQRWSPRSESTPRFAKARGGPGQETHHPRKIMCVGEAGVLNSFQELIVQTRGAPDIFQPHSGGSGLLGNLCSCLCRFPLDPPGCFSLFSPPSNYSLISFSFHIDFWPDPCVWLQNDSCGCRLGLNTFDWKVIQSFNHEGFLWFPNTSSCSHYNILGQSVFILQVCVCVCVCMHTHTRTCMPSHWLYLGKEGSWAKYPFGFVWMTKKWWEFRVYKIINITEAIQNLIYFSLTDSLHI